MTVDEQLKKTPLYKNHLSLKAKIVPFGGWEMPVQYEGGIISEYQQTREKVSLFDISHMGEFIIEGDAVQSGLDRIVTMSIRDMPAQSCRYGMILNEQGGVIDDLIVFRLDDQKWFVVVNGATTEKDARHFQKHLNKDAVFTDVSMRTGKIDVQGPQSRDFLKAFVPGVEKLQYYHFNFFDLLGHHVLISRTGYTGELGYEIYYPWEHTEALWNELLKSGQAKPAGLGARDLLRLEMGYSLYGHELGEHISPLVSGLNRFIDFEKDFIGKDALVKEQKVGVRQKIVGLLASSRRSPREGHAVYDGNKKEIGKITSGTFSPFLNAGIGLGFVDQDAAVKGRAVMIGNEKGSFPATICARSFYAKGSLKN